MLRFVLLSAAVAVAIASAGDCGSFTNCQTCVESPLCGWCSVPVQYSDGSKGPQCAGFSKGSKPFVCPEVYSTEICQRGWECNLSNGTCDQSAPGTGIIKSQCERECGKIPPPPSAKVYLCDEETKTCKAVSPTSPNNGSLAICEAKCEHKITPKPGPVAKTYTCNTSSWTCEVAKPGHGASKQVCDEACSKNATKHYVCNNATKQCEPLPPLTPGGIPLTTCEEICQGGTNPPTAIPPSPAPPPEYIGIWRAVEIQKNYKIVEWDIKINISTAIFSERTVGKPSTFIGKPYHIPDSAKLEMWIVITSGPGAGQTVRTIGDTSGARAPNTEYGTLAMAKVGEAAPSTIDSAMTDGTSTVFAMTKCLIDDKDCIFVMPSNLEEERRSMKQESVKIESQATLDKCSQYDEDCQICIQHADCGWCSVPVHYADGSKGTQCAGFQGGGNDTFICPGRYSTTNCEVGYACQSGTFECKPTDPGNGMPKAVCEATCKPTPPPAPRPKLYTCDTTTHQCVPCKSGQCPGAMPLKQCDEVCPHPHPGPTPALQGVWRGIEIQERYPIGEYDWSFEQTGLTVYKSGVEYFTGDITVYGNTIQVRVKTGDNAGKTFWVMFQMATQDFGLYTQMTLARGEVDGSVPANFNEPMYNPKMKTWVVAKCLKAPCEFPRP